METFLEVFRKHRMEQGQKTALVCGSEQITYEELGRRSDQIAKFLQDQGTSKDEVVAVLLERSIDCIAAFLGIWKAGSAFTYLSTKFPKERIQLICQDCHVRILLDKKALSSALAQPEKDSFSGAYPALDDAAMALYTSGSTGRPKGILHDHRSILHTVQRQLKVTGLSSEDVFLGNSPFYFVSLLLEVITPLYAGCTIHFFLEKDCRKIPLIEAYMVEHAVTASCLTVQLLKHFKNRSKTLRLVLTGSERVSQVKGEGYKLLNLYGSSETGGPIFGFFVDRRYDNAPIGIPEEGTCAYLLDEKGSLAAEGEAGELCLSGVFARGYIGLPEQTTAAFTKNPFFEQDGHAVLYHTGDIARWLPDGNLLYVNRKDWQVKINGQRVELGEIEAVLASVEGVEGAVVQAFTKKNGQNYLCAYYLAEEEISRQKLKKSLREKLPDYMVPEFFVRLESFPLNMNGKLDRKQLRAPKFHDKQIYRAPRTPLEKVICEGFSEVLKKPSIGLDSDFYLLGGDSLSVMELVVYLQEKGVYMQGDQVVMASTPEKLAAKITHEQAQVKKADIPKKVLRDSDLDLTIVQTDGRNSDFAMLCAKLYAFFGKIISSKVVSKEKYEKYNQLDQIQYAFVAYDGKKPIGCACFTEYDKVSAEAKHLYVEPEYRGTSVAEQLTYRQIEVIRRLGYHRMIASSGVGLKDAMALYRRMGYHQIEPYGPFIGMEGAVCIEYTLHDESESD